MPHSSDRFAVYVLTRQGLALCRQLSGYIEADVFISRQLLDAETESGLAPIFTHSASIRPVPFDSLGEAITGAFPLYSCHLFIAATGIVVRMIAPLITHKACDPAVLVADQQGRFVISLLSGHLGGANTYAKRIAELLGAQPVITTATDSEGLPAIDELAVSAGLHIASLTACKRVSAALLRGEPVYLYDPRNALGLHDALATDAAREPDHTLPACPFTRITDFGDALHAAKANACVIVSERVPTDECIPTDERVLPEDAYTGLCRLHPKNLFVGIGLRRGASRDAVLAALTTCLEQNALSLHSVSGLASVDIKADEPGLCAAAESLNSPLGFYSAAELGQFPCSRPSAKAMEVLGIPGVCESAALAAATGLPACGGSIRAVEGGKYDAELLVPKQIHGPVTVAVARRVAVR